MSFASNIMLETFLSIVKVLVHLFKVIEVRFCNN